MTAGSTPLTQPACFDTLAERVCTPGRSSDGRPLRVSLYLAAESSQFVRFNHARVRQALRVVQGDGAQLHEEGVPWVALMGSQGRKITHLVG